MSSVFIPIGSCGFNIYFMFCEKHKMDINEDVLWEQLNESKFYVSANLAYPLTLQPLTDKGVPYSLNSR